MILTQISCLQKLLILFNNSHAAVCPMEVNISPCSCIISKSEKNVINLLNCSNQRLSNASFLTSLLDTHWSYSSISLANNHLDRFDSTVFKPVLEHLIKSNGNIDVDLSTHLFKHSRRVIYKT